MAKRFDKLSKSKFFDLYHISGLKLIKSWVLQLIQALIDLRGFALKHESKIRRNFHQHFHDFLAFVCYCFVFCSDPLFAVV